MIEELHPCVEESDKQINERAISSRSLTEDGIQATRSAELDRLEGRRAKVDARRSDGGAGLRGTGGRGEAQKRREARPRGKKAE